MVAPVYATDLTDFYLEGASTVTALGGGGAALGNPETDFFIQGSSCLSKGAWTNAIKGFIVDALATTFTVPTDGAIIGFSKYDAVGSLATQSAGGLRIIAGSGNGDYYHYYVGGSDTLAFNSWVPYVIDPNTATADATTGTPSGAERWVGVLANLPTTSGPTKGNPIALDSVRFGRCRVDYTNGETANYATFLGAEAYGNDPSRRWGLIEKQGGAYLIQGFHQFGTSGTAVDMRDSNKVLFWRPAGANNVSNNAVSTAFNRMELVNASSNLLWDNIIIQSLGTRARGQFVHTAGTLTMTSCQFIDWDTFTFLAGASMTAGVFRRCNAITAPGSTLNGTQILNSTVATNTSALVWNVSTNPSGKLDDMEFSKGTNAHHAIEFGTAIAGGASITLNNCSFSGFSATEGGTTGDETFHFKATSGTITLNLVGCSGNMGYRSEGATINLVIDPVTTSVSVVADGSAVSGARVLVETSASGAFPFEESVSISQTAGTATVSHTGHGLVTNNYVVIRGAAPSAYNGVKQITVTGPNAYTYTIDSGTSSPATGTPVASAALISAVTTGTGIVTDTRTFSANQPIKGWVRKTTSSPFYKTGDIVGTVNSTTGLSVTVQLVSDE